MAARDRPAVAGLTISLLMIFLSVLCLGLKLFSVMLYHTHSSSPFYNGSGSTVHTYEPDWFVAFEKCEWWSDLVVEILSYLLGLSVALTCAYALKFEKPSFRLYRWQQVSVLLLLTGFAMYALGTMIWDTVEYFSHNKWNWAKQRTDNAITLEAWSCQAPKHYPDLAWSVLPEHCFAERGVRYGFIVLVAALWALLGTAAWDMFRSEKVVAKKEGDGSFEFTLFGRQFSFMRVESAIRI